MNWLWFILGTIALPCGIAAFHLLCGRRQDKQARAALERARLRHLASQAAKGQADFWAHNSRKHP